MTGINLIEMEEKMCKPFKTAKSSKKYFSHSFWELGREEIFKTHPPTPLMKCENAE
jgi:hypothetical protein